MATYQENLITTRDNVAAALAAMTASPKPDYVIDGERYSWGRLFESYTEKLEALNKLIDANDPQEATSYGYSPLD